MKLSNALTWYFPGGPVLETLPSSEGGVDLIAGQGGQRARCLHGITDSMDMSLIKLWEIVKDRQAWHATVHRVTKSQTQLSNLGSHMPLGQKTET